jgi:GTP-binding nuclear protein Ran
MEFKLVILGEGGVGKTSFVQRHNSGEFVKKYEPTHGVDVSTVSFSTNKGDIHFKCWDVAGQNEFTGFQDGYYIKADCAIIMFDVSSRLSYKQIPIWYKNLIRVSPNVKVVICANKVDLRTRQVKVKDVVFHRKHNLQYYEMSTKSTENYEKPFQYLAKVLLKDNNVHFTKTIAKTPPSVKGKGNSKTFDKEVFEKALKTPLPE